MLVPVIGLVQVGQHAMADRYTYLPQIGLCIAAAWSVGWAVEHWPKTRGYWIAASVLVLLVLMGRAWHQTTFWRDSQTLWTRALACTSANSTAHVNLGAFLVEQGRTAEAVAHYRQALELRPRNADAHTNLGALMAAAGRVEQAVAHYRQAIEINPGSAETHFNLGVAMARLGNTSEAISHYQNALRIDPDLVEAHANLGGALESQNRTDEAIEHYRAAVAMAQRQNKPALHQAILSRLHSLGESPGQRRSTR